MAVDNANHDLYDSTWGTNSETLTRPPNFSVFFFLREKILPYVKIFEELYVKILTLT